MSFKIITLNLSDYGAIELKEFIRKTTYKSFAYTISFMIFLFLTFAIVKYLSEEELLSAPLRVMSIDLEMIDQAPPEDAAPPPPPPPPVVVNSGPAARAGTPVPIPDADLSPDMQDFADLDVLDRASSEGGDGLDLGGFDSDIDFEGDGVNIEAREVEPKHDEFIFVEQEADIDIVKLQKLVIYPEMAIRAGIEGEVHVQILVGKDGKVRKTRILMSDNKLLNDAALDAIKRYGHIPPAIQDKQPIMMWVTVPIVFKLR